MNIITQDVETMIGKAMLAHARREGHKPKRIRNLSEQVKVQAKTYRPRKGKTQDVLNQLSQPRSTTETAKLVGIGRKNCNDIIRRLSSNNRVVQFGRRIDDGKSVPLYVAADHMHKFDQPKTSQEIALDTIGDGQMTLEQIQIHSDLSLDLVVNAINNLRRRGLVTNISDNPRNAIYQRTEDDT